MIKLNCLKYGLIFSTLFNINQGFPQDAFKQSKKDYEDFPWVSDTIKNNMQVLGDYGVKREISQYILAYQGIKPKELEELEKNGLDISRNDYINTAVFNEVVALGKLSKVGFDTSSDACYHSIFTFNVYKFFRVPEHLKDKKELKVLYYNGPIGNEGHRTQIAGTKNPDVGIEMLLFAGHPYLEYVTYHDRWCTTEYPADYLLPSHNSPVLIGNKLKISPFETGIRIDGDPDLSDEMSLDEFIKKYIIPVNKILNK